MIIDEKIEKPLLDLGLVRGYSDKTAQYYRLPTMDFHLIWIFYNESGVCECCTPTDLYIIDDTIVSSINKRHYSKVSDAIPTIKYLIRQHKELMIVIKKRELEQDFKNE